jgi:hypothetical protein
MMSARKVNQMYKKAMSNRMRETGLQGGLSGGIQGGLTNDGLEGGLFGLSSSLQVMRKIERYHSKWTPLLFDMYNQAFGRFPGSFKQLLNLYKLRPEGPSKDIFKVGLSNLVDIINERSINPRNLSFDLYTMKLIDTDEYLMNEEARPKKFKISNLKN